MSRASLALKAVGASLILSAVTVILVFGAVMAGASFLLGPSIQFGLPTAYLLDLLLPQEVIYQLVPEGGGPAFIGFALIGAVFQLFLIYAIGTYALWFSRRAR